MRLHQSFSMSASSKCCPINDVTDLLYRAAFMTFL